MLEHEAVQRNLATLAARGVRFVEPGEGFLACGWIGKGRLAEPDDVVQAADQLFARRPGRCGAATSLVTAGPTYEDLDPVRFVGNRSSGRMGTPSPPRRRPAARRSCSSPGPRALHRRRCAKSCVCEAPPRCTTPCWRAPSGPTPWSWRRPWRTTRPRQSTPQKIAHDADALTLQLRRTRDILGDLAAWRAERGRLTPGAGRLRRGDPRRAPARARETPAEGHRSHRRQRRVAHGCRVRGRDERRDDHRRRPRPDGRAGEQGRRGRTHPRPACGAAGASPRTHVS